MRIAVQIYIEIYISYTISDDVQKHYTIYKTNYQNIRVTR